MTNRKAFLQACNATIGTTALTPRERLVFLVVAWLGEDATRKEISEFTGISKAHLSTIVGKLKIKQILSNDKVIKSFQNGNTKVSNTETSFQNGNTEVPKMETNFQNGNTEVPKMETNFQNGNFSGLSPHPSINNNINNNKRKEKNNACACEDDSFSFFWKLYPRKVDKVNVRAKWEALMAEGVDAKEILEGLQRSIQTWRETFDNIKFIPYPLKWLTEERWMDQDATDFQFNKETP